MDQTGGIFDEISSFIAYAQRTDIVESLFHTFTNAMTILPMYQQSILGAYAVPNFKPMLLSTWFSTNKDPLNDSTLVNPKYARVSDIGFQPFHSEISVV